MGARKIKKVAVVQAGHSPLKSYPTEKEVPFQFRELSKQVCLSTTASFYSDTLFQGVQMSGLGSIFPTLSIISFIAGGKAATEQNQLATPECTSDHNKSEESILSGSSSVLVLLP